MNTSSESSILGSTVYGLSGTFGLLGPFSSYRVYDVEHAKFVCSGGLLEMGVKFLDEYWFGLWIREVSLARQRRRGVDLLHTWIFAVQRVVMLVIREPDTPGGFSDSMACKPASKSATAEDMMEMTRKRDHKKLSSFKYEVSVNRWQAEEGLLSMPC
jgi:hypothetical protein